MKIFLFIAILLTYTQALIAEDLNFAIIGDAGKKTRHSEETLASIKKEGVDSLILPGDNLYSSTYTKVWSEWSNSDMRFEVVAIGNHNGGYKEEISFFNMPAEYYYKVYEEKVRFIVLNSDNTDTVVDQMVFLEQQLNTAKEPIIFLVYHHPTFSLSHRHKWQEKRNFQLAIRPLLKKYRSKLTGLLVGHDHLALLAEYDTLPVILSGAIHEVRLDIPINSVQDNVAVKTKWFFDGKPYWAKLTISDLTTEANLNFVRASDNSVQCTAILVTGQPMAVSKNCEESYSIMSILKGAIGL